MIHLLSWVTQGSTLLAGAAVPMRLLRGTRPRQGDPHLPAAAVSWHPEQAAGVPPAPPRLESTGASQGASSGGLDCPEGVFSGQPRRGLFRQSDNCRGVARTPTASAVSCWCLPGRVPGAIGASRRGVIHRRGAMSVASGSSSSKEKIRSLRLTERRVRSSCGSLLTIHFAGDCE